MKWIGKNNWGRWTHIGVVEKSAPQLRNGLYALYSVMERINSKTGMREYKEVIICSFVSISKPIELQPNPA